MTAKHIYDTALSLLGYTDHPNFQRRAVAVVNKVFFELFVIFENDPNTFEPIGSLSDSISLPQKALVSAMPAGVAAGLALGEGDGELQQYFAAEYDRAVRRFNRREQIKDSY